MKYLKEYYHNSALSDFYIPKPLSDLGFEKVLERPLASAFNWQNFMDYYSLNKVCDNIFLQEVYRENFENVKKIYNCVSGTEKLIYNEIMFIYKKDFYTKLVKKYKEIEEWM